jgi:hypothetical protein
MRPLRPVNPKIPAATPAFMAEKVLLETI